MIQKRNIALFNNIEKSKKNNSLKRKALIGGTVITGLVFGRKPMLRKIKQLQNNQKTKINLSKKSKSSSEPVNENTGATMSQLRNNSSQIYRNSQDLGNRRNQIAPSIFPDNPLLKNAKNLSGDMRGVLKRRQKMKSNTKTSPNNEQRKVIRKIQDDWREEFNQSNNLDVLPINQNDVPKAQAIIKGRADLNVLRNYKTEGVLPPNSKLKTKAENILYDYSRLKNNTSYEEL